MIYQIYRQAMIFLPLLLLCSALAMAQYSEDVHQLRSASDQYDERGHEGSKALSVDGAFSVNPSNGNVAYSYPISQHVRGGYPIDVTLNYCGSVAFTMFRRYATAHELRGSLYEGWQKFNFNKPAWIMGVNGFAINALVSTTAFHPDSTSRVFDPAQHTFDDRDFVGVVDGYHFCNRMMDMSPYGGNQAGYVDQIHLLRSDGSVMTLLNKQSLDIGDSLADEKTTLYTGYYVENQANTHSYGIVEYEPMYWPQYIQDLLVGRANSFGRAGLAPRRLRYFDGSGLEYLFREWVIPFGSGPYRDVDRASGGVYGGPTIFYLEEIKSNSGTLMTFHRTRHYPVLGNPLFLEDNDVTRGRALITEFDGHKVSWGHNSMLVEALGRTTKVIFDTVYRGGRATATDIFPLANVGGMTPLAKELTRLPETDQRLYKSFVGQVTRIVDPAGRVTTFDYERFQRTYEDFHFPWPNIPGTPQRVTLGGHRMKRVIEPDVRYEIHYAPGANVPITREMSATSDLYQETLSNVVDTVGKYDTYGNLLTSDLYVIDFGNQNSTHYITDHIDGTERSITRQYASYPLYNLVPSLPPARHTALISTIEVAGDKTTATTTAYAKGAQIPGATGGGDYLILPAHTWSTTNGIVTGFRKFSYTIDTVRRFGGDNVLAGRYGMEVTRKVARTLRPDDTSRVLLIDTTDYLHLPALDTTVTWAETRWKKLPSLQNYFYYRDAGDPRVAGKRWEDVCYDEPVAVFQTDTLTAHVTAPPIFDLELTSWTSDSAGIIAGKRNVYLTGVTQGAQRELRGNLIADSLIVRGGRRVPGNTYSYITGAGMNLLGSVRDAQGAETRFSYSPYGNTTDDPIPQIIPEPDALVLDNRDSVTPRPVQGSLFSYLYAQPLATRKIVRRFNDTGLVRDTLAEFTERTYFGLPSGTRDANGWYSRAAYDHNGRLVTSWLPLDFPPPADQDTIYQGERSSELYGISYYNRRVDDLECRKDPVTGIVTATPVAGTVQTTLYEDTLFASKPVTVLPDCPCESDPMAREKDTDRELQVSCNVDIPFNNNAGYDAVYGQLWYRIDSAGPLKMAATVDSLILELMAASVDGECLHLEVALDGVFTRTFVFNCPGGDDDPDGTGRANGDGKGGSDRSLQSGDGSSLTPVEGGYKLRVNLTSVAPQLKALLPGSDVAIKLRMKTAGGTVVFLNGTASEDMRPKMIVKGGFHEIEERADYTLAFQHHDDQLRTVQFEKVDDIRHTENRLDPQDGTVRRIVGRHYFGADDRLLRSEELTLEDGVWREDVEQFHYTGLGARRRITDAEGDSSITSYNDEGLPVETINTDGSSATTTYQYGAPGDFSISGQDFLGFCTLVTDADENGIRTAKYFDALGRLRRVVDDVDSLRLMVLYEYDVLDRPTLTVTPKGDSIRYSYDDFGHVRTKTHPDAGITSYAYDDEGNLRFTQTQKQASEGRLTFRQYDDLGRLTHVGEASLDVGYYEGNDDVCPDCYGTEAHRDDDDTPTAGAWNGGDAREPGQKLHAKRNGKGRERSLQSGGDRLTDQIDPNILHDDDAGSILTANRTLLLPPVREVPRIPRTFFFRSCAFPPDTSLGETEQTPLPLMMRATREYPEASIPAATAEDFEHAARYPEFGRQGIAYDALPEPQGPVWGDFPDHYEWDLLAPHGHVRNQRGHTAATATRERAGDPYNYTVYSYDERGRVEAVLRFSEALGFEAVYHRYNSLNRIIRTTVADPFRQYTTYYGHDVNGRIDSVWTAMGGYGNGLWAPGFGFQYPYPLDRPDSADILYRHTRTGQVDSIAYPPVHVGIKHLFGVRKWLDSVVAKRYMPGLGTHVPLFMQALERDSTGQILSQTWRHGTGQFRRQFYTYDRADRLKGWRQNSDTVGYRYDLNGNRLEANSNAGVLEDEYTYQPGGNRIIDRVLQRSDGTTRTTLYSYNTNGSVVERRHLDIILGSGRDSVTEQYAYSYRELQRRHLRLTPEVEWGVPRLEEEWRYRYSAAGERTQKRRVFRRWLDTLPVAQQYHPWTHYLLGSNEQLAVLHGREMTEFHCGDSGRRTYMYPKEYLTYALDYTGTPEDVSRVITKPDGGKQFRISDHLASLRVTVDSVTTAAYDYDPWGKLISAPVTGVSRRTYNDREKDRESGTYNNGVRQLSDDEGRFGAVDKLWEATPGISPYVYGNNNPLRYTDPDGLQVKPQPRNPVIQWPLEPTPPVAGGAASGGGGRSTARSGAGRTSSGTMSASKGRGTSKIIVVRPGAIASTARGAQGLLGGGIRGGKLSSGKNSGGKRNGGTQLTAKGKTKKDQLRENKENGERAEEQAKKDLLDEGNELLGSQVTVKTSKGRRRVDHLIRKPSGEIEAVEVKAGNAVRSSSQRAKDQAMEREGGTPVGKNAPNELRGTKMKIKTTERRYP